MISLSRPSVAALLSLKINIDDDCFAYKPSAELLRLNKSAVCKYNEEHGTYQHVQ